MTNSEAKTQNCKAIIASATVATLKALIWTLSVLGLLITLLLAPGCSTTGQKDSSPVKTSEIAAGAIRAVIPIAVSVAARKDTNAIAYFRLSSIAINGLVDSGKYDPETLKAALDAVSVKELNSREAQAAVEAALNIYRAYWGEKASAFISKSPWAPTILKAIADSLIIGLPGG